MYARAITLAALLISIAGTAPVIAQDWTVGIEGQFWNADANLDFPQPPGQKRFSEYPDEEFFPSLGLSIQHGSWFFLVSSYFEVDYDGNHRLTAQSIDNQPTLTATADWDVRYGASVEREDLDLTIGYAFDSGFSVFGGYKSIEFTENIVEQALFVDVTLDTGDGNPLVSNFDEDSLGVTLGAAFENAYEYTGPFIGVGYIINFASSNFSLSGSAAYADLDGDSDLSGQFPEPSEVEIPRPSSVTPGASLDADGFSITLKLSYDFTENFSAAIGYKTQDYSQDGSALVPDLESSGAYVSARYLF